MSKKTTTINSNAYAYMKSLLNLTEKFKVTDLYVKGKWLTAELSSGVRFSVLNNAPYYRK